MLSTSSTSAFNKTVEQAALETKKQMAALMAKQRVMTAILKAFPDACQAILENGETCYTSNMVNGQFKGAKVEVMRGQDGRLLIRHRVKFGTETYVYSKSFQTLDSRTTLEYLNQYLNTPNGRSLLEKSDKH